MLFSPTPLMSTIPDERLAKDRKECLRFGPCGVGAEALYLGGRFLDRRFYIPWRDVRRVFKRVAMSKNGFTGKGIFGSMPFLVVQFGNGAEKDCPFKHEQDVDRLLAAVEEQHPRIPTHSAEAQKKLERARAAEEARYLKKLSPKAADAVSALAEDRSYLEEKPELSNALVLAAKQKRVIDQIPRSMRIGGIVLAVLSLGGIAFGIAGLLTHFQFAPFFLLGGAALFFLVLSSNVLPGKWNNRAYAAREWESAVRAMREYLAGRPAFALSPQYAHPIVLTRMIRVIREGRAQDAAAALAAVKEDLKALNSSVKVSQQEFDEVTTVKPLFLVCNYQDEPDR